MELRSNTSVLRSNAPALTDSPKGVLQVSSGNVGSNNLEATFGVPKGAIFEKYETDVPPLSAIPRCQSAQASLKLQHRKQRRVKDEDPYSLDTYPMYTQIITQAERLSPRYQAYREKQRKELVKGSNHEQVWPDELEEIFQQALRVIPNWGRKKRLLDGKLSGRNEWISRYILIHSGVKRDRKQVSSHIQVLKPFLEDNPIWMKFVTDKDSNAEPGFRSSIDFQTPIITEAQLLMPQPLPPLGILGSNVAPQAPCLRQIEFEMYVLDALNKSVHTYTRTQSEIGSARKLLEDVDALQLAYPDLELYYDEPKQNGEVVLFESDLKLMDSHPAPGSKLGVDFFVDITRGMEFKNWKYKTRFYEKGVPVKFQENNYLPQDDHKANLVEGVSGPLKHSQIPQTDDAKLEIAFRSSWWVTVFFNMTNKKLKITEETNGDPQALKQEEDRASRYLEEMSVMQEVFATPRTGATKQHRVCTFLWKFRLAQNNPTATTTWRKLNIPNPEVKAESPAPSPITPIYQPSMTLDTAPRYTTCPQPNPLYAEHFDHNTNSLFIENSESILAAAHSESDSSSSTPTAHDASFSTTASYEPSISSSRLPPYTSQPPAYHLQDFGYTTQDTNTDSQESIGRSEDYAFSSQVSTYMSQETIFDVQDPGCASPDPANQSHQDLYYVSQADSVYNTQEDQSISDYREVMYATQQQGHYDQMECAEPIDDTETQDFSGGQIHLSFTEQPDDQQPPLGYNSPYAADAEGQPQLESQKQQLEHHQPQIEDHELEYYQLQQHQEYTHHQQQHFEQNQQQSEYLQHKHQDQHQNLPPFDPTSPCWPPSLWPTMHFHPLDFSSATADIEARLDGVPRHVAATLDEAPHAIRHALEEGLLPQQGQVLGEVQEDLAEMGEGEGPRKYPKPVKQGLGEGKEQDWKDEDEEEGKEWSLVKGLIGVK